MHQWINVHQAMKTSKANQVCGEQINNSVYNPGFLRQQARWIRDDLDPQVARDGPDALHSDDILTLDEFLRRLLTSRIPLDDIRFSRLHLAVIAICGHATRWPKKLIERADSLQAAWEAQYGSLTSIILPLYEPGGRLNGICKPEDLSKEKLIIKWLKTPGVKLSPILARKVGNLGFKAGDWWISALFAFKDGIIDSAEAAGGIVADADGAYAILMTGDEEINGASPDEFTYRARNHDRGRYRLTAATRDSRQPVRVLRAHGLRSLWAPKAGVRYEGLYVVAGWSIAAQNKDMVYEIQFKRLANEPSMETVLRRPYSDEIEDYREYKRIRQAARLAQEDAAKAKREVGSPAITVSSDGALDGFEEDLSNLEEDTFDLVRCDSVMVDDGDRVSESKTVIQLSLA